jgi:malonate transporter and related proteins
MLEILSITGPIYIIIALGFAATRLGRFTKADMGVLGKFVVNFALPALLFKSLSQRPAGEILDSSYLLAYATGTLVLIGSGYFWSRRWAGQDATTSTIYVMGMSCSNSAFVGYPILLLTMAPISAVALALNMIVENLLIIPLLLVVADRSCGMPDRWYRVVGQSFRRLAANPIIIAIFTGFGVSLAGWRLPVALVQTVGILAPASGALALFVIGGTLVGLPMQGLGRRVAPIALGKLVFHPLAVLGTIQLLSLAGLPMMAPPLKTAAVLMAAMPTMSIFTILAQIYAREELAAAAMLVTTICSFFTISGLLILLQPFPV